MSLGKAGMPGLLGPRCVLPQMTTPPALPVRKVSAIDLILDLPVGSPVTSPKTLCALCMEVPSILQNNPKAAGENVLLSSVESQ